MRGGGKKRLSPVAWLGRLRIESFFEFADALGQVGQFLDGNDLALGLRGGDGWVAHVLLVALEIVDDT